ncbi:MAG TPA: ABC transporter permease [Bacteroidota bacterium]|nr:ABC transporter permease [Bacteroidota bacterium]
MALHSPRRFGIWAALLAEIVILTALTSTVGGPSLFESTFLNFTNLSQVIRALSFIAIMAVGQSPVIISGGIDLAVGSLLGLSGVVTAVFLTFGMNIAVAGTAGIAVGLLSGIINGVIITRAKLPPFIVTLGSMSMLRGLAFAITGGETIRSLPPEFLALGQGSVAGVPVPIVIMGVVAFAVGYLLKASAWGRYVYAIGGNEQAAVYSGVDVHKIKLTVYALSGLCAGIAGVLFTARFGVGQSTAGLGYELDVIAAAVIGGISLTGGRGTILGAIMGSLLMGILRNGLVLLNVSPYWQQFAIGVVIILAVIMDRKSKQ